MSPLKNYKYLWDIFTDTFGTTIFHPQFFSKQYVKESLQLALSQSKGILIDVGCGRMPYKELFLPHLKKYIGIDHPETAKLYKGKYKPDIFADAVKIPLKSASVDTVLMLMLLEHLPTPEKALKEVHRLLKSKGVCILSTVQSYPLHDAPYDYYRYTEYGLAYLAKQAGFTKIRSINQGSFWEFFGLSLNVYLFQMLLKMMKTKMSIIAILLLPFFYNISVLTNIFCFLLSRFEDRRRGNFTINHVILLTK